ncbi:hypothetical protein FAZ15_10590 [Sphingobacterium olei]|uniref:Uncharacterized protein n=1 Tax=Sphingobacterium olei TaxID=2571155 RepID=A0A4U0P1R5_9SPHI|nr:hypothetical protein [Sphingobacterium olei]TJZ60442.1 hypothetical protein FAZ15_10590 [Sphingobacterium olei]
MSSFLLMLFLAGGLSSLIPFQEIVKIIIILFTIPVILFVSVRMSQNPSVWLLTEEHLIITFRKKEISYPLAEIDYIQSLTRSGGALYVIHFHKKSPSRYWRNKLFQEEDDNKLLHHALIDSAVEYYKF